MRKKHVVVLAAAFVSVSAAIFAVYCFYRDQSIEPECDPAYYWSEKTVDIGNWIYEELPTGHKYFLYLPPDFRSASRLATEKIPLIVTFHGSCEKYSALKYAKPFTEKDFQNRVAPSGCAVLAVMARTDYFTDVHSMSLLIQNILIKYSCLDKSNIIGYGFSQGAEYVVRLACAEPKLFKGVMSGSGYYQISLRELLSVLHINFYSAISRNDKGIYEQGYKTGRLCGMFCKGSRYVEYDNRYHFWIELKDRTGKGEETACDWIINVIQR